MKNNDSKGKVHWSWLILIAVIFLFLGNLWHVMQEKHNKEYEQSSAEITLQLFEREIMNNRPFLYQGVEFMPMGERCYQYQYEPKN